MKWKTWEEWKLEGYFVNFKEKSTRRNEKGKCLFSEKQVSLKDEYTNDYPPEWIPDLRHIY